MAEDNGLLGGPEVWSEFAKAGSVEFRKRGATDEAIRQMLSNPRIVAKMAECALAEQASLEAEAEKAGVVGNMYPVHVPPDSTVEGLVRAASGEETELGLAAKHFKNLGKTGQDKLQLVHSDDLQGLEYVTDAVGLLKWKGLEPVEVGQFLVFVRENPDLDLSLPIVALGSQATFDNAQHWCPVLRGRRPGLYRLGGGPYPTEFKGPCWFLVRKITEPSK